MRTEEPPEEAADLGFPAFATSNTTRVAGADSIADAAGIALATFPTGGAVEGPNAVTLVPADDWAAGIAAASLVSDPIGAPILLTDDDELPELTADALASLAPAGSAETDNRQVFAIGSRAGPGGARSRRGSRARTPPRSAAEVARAARAADRGAARAPPDRELGRLGVRDAGGGLGGPLGRPGAVRAARLGAGRDAAR